MMVLRVSDRRTPPVRVEGVDPDTPLDKLREIACWALGRGAPQTGCRVSSSGRELRGVDTIASSGLQNNALVFVDFCPAADGGGDATASAPKPRLPEPSSAADVCAVGLMVRGLEVGSGGIVMSGTYGPQAASRAVRLSPARPPVGEGRRLWQLYLSGDIFTEREKRHYLLAPSSPVLEVNRRLRSLTVASVIAAADRTFLSIRFSHERTAALWVHQHSPVVRVLPFEVLLHISSFLSPAGEMEVSAVEEGTGLAVPLSPFDQLESPGGGGSGLSLGEQQQQQPCSVEEAESGGM